MHVVFSSRPPIGPFFPARNALAWAAAWLLASRADGMEVSVFEPNQKVLRHGRGIPNFNPEDRLMGRIGSRLCRPDAAPAEALFAFCSEHEVAVDRCGELFLAGESETARLLELFQSGTRRGLNLLNLPPTGLRSRYPDADFPKGVRGLLDLDTGVVDVAELLRSLRSRAEVLGVRAVKERPRKAWWVEPAGGSKVEISMGSMQPIQTPTFLASALPEPGFPGMAPCVGAGLGMVEVRVRPRWRHFTRARGTIKRLLSSDARLQAQLPEDWRCDPNTMQRLPLLLGETPLDQNGQARSFSVDRTKRRRLSLSHASPEPVDLFPLASQIVDRILEEVNP